MTFKDINNNSMLQRFVKDVESGKLVISKMPIDEKLMAVELERYSRHFLGHKNLFIVINGTTYKITSELYFGAYQVMFSLFEEEPVVLVRCGVRLIGFVYIKSLTYFHTASKEKAEKFATIFVKIFFHLKHNCINKLFSENPQKRVLIIADDRPSHFIRQAIGGVYLLREYLSNFTNKNGQIFYLEDKCLVNPRVAFGESVKNDISAKYEEDVYLSGVGDSMLIHRIYRSSIESVEWMRYYLNELNLKTENSISSTKTKSLCLLVSLEVEKSRWLNQQEQVSLLIKRINLLSIRYKLKLVIYVDCWTFSDFATDAEINQSNVVKRADSIVEAIQEHSGCKLHRIYTKRFTDKVIEIAGIDIAITPHGTAALIPCKILKKPTITFGSKAQLKHTEDLDMNCWFPLSGEFIDEDKGNDGIGFPLHKYCVSSHGILKQILFVYKKFNVHS